MTLHLCVSGLRLLLVTLALLIVPVSGAQAAPRTGTPPPLGKLVDVGGWKLHIHCSGETRNGSPTVVFETGAGGFSFDAALVQASVSEFTRACSYDRAGSAWSELGPRTRTMQQIAYELHTLLLNSGIKGPYVLVGSSIGGLYVRWFARQYPADVAGLVLVDGTSEDSRLVRFGRLVRVRETSAGRPIPPIQKTITPAEKQMSDEEKKMATESLEMGPPGNFGPFGKLPPPILRLRTWAAKQPEHYVENSPYWGEEWAQLYADRQPPHEHPLGDIPLIVLVRGIYMSLDGPEDRDHAREQAEMAHLSTNSKLIVARNSGHVIALDEPQVVTAAIREVIQSLQQHTRLGKSTAGSQ